MSMTEEEKQNLYRQVISQLCYENGGSLKLGPPPDEFDGRSGTLMNRLTEDGGIEFKHVMDDMVQ